MCIYSCGQYRRLSAGDTGRERQIQCHLVRPFLPTSGNVKLHDMRGTSGVYSFFYDPEAQRIGTGVNADGSADLIDGNLIDPVPLFF